MMRIPVSLSIFLIAVIHLKAQVPVSEEPRHHVVFANDKIRILNVILPAGDTTQYHLHSTPSVFIAFTQTKTVSQNIDKEPIAGISRAGNIWFENLNPPHSRIHRVWNVDSTAFHVMDIELLTKDSGFTEVPFSANHTQLVIDTPWVRVYSVELDSGEQVNLKNQHSDLLLIAISDGTLQLIENGIRSRSFIRSGNFYHVKPGDILSATNEANTAIKFALLEIK